MIAYRADVLTPDEIAAQDPFGGTGTRLDTGEQSHRDAVAMIRRDFPGCAYVIFPDCAWVEPGDRGIGETTE